MRIHLPVLYLLLLAGCVSKTASDKSTVLVSMQLIDRNGFTETISNKERLSSLQSTDFLTPQPYQKVLRIYGRNSQGRNNSRITSYHDNGNLHQYLEAIDGRANGLYQERFANGQLKIEAHLVEGIADLHDLAQATWVFDGPSTVWDEQGNRIAQFFYEKGLLVSQGLHFFQSGAVQQILPYENGLLHGLCQTFDEQGNLIQETPFREGKREGKATTLWGPDRFLSVEVYTEDKLVEATYWNSEGKEVASVKEGHGQQALFEENTLVRLSSIKEGVIEGEILLFSPQGSLHSSFTLHEGKKQGPEWEYYPCKRGETPRPKIQLHWEEDQIQGQVKTWYPCGQLESQREIHGNQKHGTSFAWYENGDLMLNEEYENDLLVKGAYYKKGDKKAVSKIDAGKGTAYLYTKEGLFLKKVPYEKGKPLLATDSVH